MFNNLQKYTIANTLMHSFWWMGIAPLYYLHRGISFEQTLIILSVFSIAMVVAEYPTGVIADAYSHKSSVALGSVLSAITMFLVAMPGSYSYYILLSVLLAIGSSMRSGSNTAVLHTISDKFKKDLAHINSIFLMWNVFTASAGAYLFTIDFRLPYLLTAACSLISVYFFLSINVRDDRQNTNGNIYKTARNGLAHIKKNHLLASVLLMAGAFAAFFYSIKWIAPMFLDIRGISPEYLGFILSGGLLVLALSTKLSGGKYDVGIKVAVIMILCGILLLGISANVFVMVFAILIIYFFRGFFSTNITVLINQNAKDDIRASILSLQSLVGRLMMSVYTFTAGVIVGAFSLWWLTVITCAILAFFVVLFVFVNTAESTVE